MVEERAPPATRSAQRPQAAAIPLAQRQREAATPLAQRLLEVAAFSAHNLAAPSAREPRPEAHLAAPFRKCENSRWWVSLA